MELHFRSEGERENTISFILRHYRIARVKRGVGLKIHFLPFLTRSRNSFQ